MKIQTSDPQRVSKLESREPENGEDKHDFNRPNLKPNGHRKGQGQLSEIPSRVTLSAAAYPFKKPPDSRPPTPEIYWPTTPKD